MPNFSSSHSSPTDSQTVTKHSPGSSSDSNSGYNTEATVKPSGGSTPPKNKQTSSSIMSDRHHSSHQSSSTSPSKHRSSRHSSGDSSHSHSHSKPKPSSSSKHHSSPSTSRREAAESEGKGKRREKDTSRGTEPDDWSTVESPEERRRIQNRLAQRKFRTSPPSPAHILRSLSVDGQRKLN